MRKLPCSLTSSFYNTREEQDSELPVSACPSSRKRKRGLDWGLQTTHRPSSCLGASPVQHCILTHQVQCCVLTHQVQHTRLYSLFTSTIMYSTQSNRISYSSYLPKTISCSHSVQCKVVLYSYSVRFNIVFYDGMNSINI